MRQHAVLELPGRQSHVVRFIAQVIVYVSREINLLQMERGIGDVVSYLINTYGTLESPDLPNQEVTKQTLLKAYNSKLKASGPADFRSGLPV